MITVMQGIFNVKLKTRAKAENVVRISEESLRNPEDCGGIGKKSNEMGATNYTREAAWTLLNTYTYSSSLLKHALAVEACMGAHGDQQATLLSRPLEEQKRLRETYCITGLLHDFDYEQFPSAEQHPFVGNRILAEQGWPEEIRDAIMGHATPACRERLTWRKHCLRVMNSLDF